MIQDRKKQKSKTFSKHGFFRSSLPKTVRVPPYCFGGSWELLGSKNHVSSEMLSFRKRNAHRWSVYIVCLHQPCNIHSITTCVSPVEHTGIENLGDIIFCQNGCFLFFFQRNHLSSSKNQPDVNFEKEPGVGYIQYLSFGSQVFIQGKCFSERWEISTDHCPFFMVQRLLAAPGDTRTDETMRISPRLT